MKTNHCCLFISIADFFSEYIIVVISISYLSSLREIDLHWKKICPLYFFTFVISLSSVTQVMIIAYVTYLTDIG